MRRDNRIQIRWTDWEKEQIDEARGDSDFSLFVREAALERAQKINEQKDGVSD